MVCSKSYHPNKSMKSIFSTSINDTSSTRTKGSTGAIHQKGKTPDRRGKGLVGLVVGRCWACPMWPMWAMWAYQHCPALHYHPAKQTTISGKPGPKWSYSDGFHELMTLPKFPPTLGLVVGCKKTWSNAQDLGAGGLS